MSSIRFCVVPGWLASGAAGRLTAIPPWKRIGGGASRTSFVTVPPAPPPSSLNQDVPGSPRTSTVPLLPRGVVAPGAVPAISTLARVTWVTSSTARPDAPAPVPTLTAELALPPPSRVLRTSSVPDATLRVAPSVVPDRRLRLPTVNGARWPPAKVTSTPGAMATFRSAPPRGTCRPAQVRGSNQAPSLTATASREAGRCLSVSNTEAEAVFPMRISPGTRIINASDNLHYANPQIILQLLLEILHTICPDKAAT
ncbi:protein of unknown function [Rhodovastum atsumiense]|nr:protein of unknown function [Rhodovastum atsumiense]